MPTIGIRIPNDFNRCLREQAKAQGISLSDHIRIILGAHLSASHEDVEPVEVDWRILTWNLFGINEHQLRHALNTSISAFQFFSMLSKWTQVFEIRITPTTLAFIRGGRSITIKPESGGKVAAIIKVIEELNAKMLEEYDYAEDREETNSSDVSVTDSSAEKEAGPSDKPSKD